MAKKAITLHDEAFQAAIVVGSNMAGEDLVRDIVTEYLTVAGALMSADTAPAAMPGAYRLADEFERELFAWRNLPSRDGAALRACAYAIAQKAEALFALILAEKEREIEEKYQAFSIAHDQAMANGNAAQLAQARALAAEAKRDRLKVERDELVSRAEVLRVLRRLGDQDADLALYGAEDNARAREYGEAAMTRACCAVAIMPSSAGMSEAELREAVRGSVGLGLDAEDAADEVIRRIFGERS